jgi:DNA-binding NarL/FixJ family response regulator
MIRVAVATGSVRLNRALHALLKERGRFEILTSDASLDEFRLRESEASGVADGVLGIDHVAAADVIVTDIPARAGEVGAAVLLSDEDELLASVRPLRGGLALLPTSAGADQLVAAIEATAVGLAVVHPDHAGSLAARPSDDPLTPREREVLHLLAAGLGNKEIATRLVISDHTAKFHVSQILAKLNAASRAEAVSIAMRRGLVPL